MIRFLRTTALALVLLAPGVSLAVDSDGDTVDDTVDNCPSDFNLDQGDVDGDATPGVGGGDACDTDIDGDGELNDDDDCPFVSDPLQLDADGNGIGDACESPLPPFTRVGLDRTQQHFFALNLDELPKRAEVIIDLRPTALNQVLGVQVICRGADYNFSFADPQTVCFPDVPLTKVDATGQSLDGNCCNNPLAAGGTWIAPLFISLDPDLAFGNPGDANEINCHFSVAQAPGAPSGLFDLAVVARTKPRESEAITVCDSGCDFTPASVADPQGNLTVPLGDGFSGVGPINDYGCFLPSGITLFEFFPNVGQIEGLCDLDDPTPPGGNDASILYDPIPAASNWDCCVWRYADFQGLPSAPGVWATSNGNVAPLPDQDLDEAHDLCDNCPPSGPDPFASSNLLQRDQDEDGVGDICDTCFDLADPNQPNSDGVPAGDGCQCSDVNASGLVDILDVTLMTRAQAYVAVPGSYDPSRCVIDVGDFPCRAAGLTPVREALAGLGGPLVESCGP